MDGACRTARLSRARLNGVATYFIESEDYFEGRAIYGESGRDYDDNPFRFAFFSLAALAATEALGLRPDVIHVHDWQTALLPVYQRLEERSSWTPVVLTVHNLAYQGIFPRELLPRLGLPDALFHIDGIEFYGRLNFLKGGLVGAERLTTVSPSYARERFSVRSSEPGSKGFCAPVRSGSPASSTASSPMIGIPGKMRRSLLDSPRRGFRVKPQESSSYRESSV